MYPDELRRIKKVMEQAFPEEHFLLNDLAVIEKLIVNGGGGGVKTTPASELFDQVSQFCNFLQLRNAIEKERLSPTIVAFLYINDDGAAVLLAYKPKNHKPLAIATWDDESTDDPNRERLLCLLRAINEVKNAKTAMTLYVNDEILAKGSMVWCKNWEKNGWLTAKGTPVLNQDLWQSINTIRARMSRCTIRDIGEATDKTKQVYADFVKHVDEWNQ